MKTYSSPGMRPVKAETAQAAAWEFAIRKSDLERGHQRASRPVPSDHGVWMSTVQTKAGPKTVWITVVEESKSKTRSPQPLRGFCKPVSA